MSGAVIHSKQKPKNSYKAAVYRNNSNTVLKRVADTYKQREKLSQSGKISDLLTENQFSSKGSC